ncbi:MAG: formate hydrogenlyase [Peptococcaceae bacterium]|jgi:hydrogenase-4 component B|nr:formate hydrogenlyase [Peptococcaceae bacterium]
MLFYAAYLFKSSLILYILAALIALLMTKNQKTCNILVNSICILSALLGAAASVLKLTSGVDTLPLIQVHSVVPFISISMTIDNLSAYFILALSILVCCVSVYSLGYISSYIGQRNVALFYFLYTTFILSMILVLTSDNAIFFYISWEVMSLLSYFLVVFESEKSESQRAGKLYIIMTHLATAFLLVGFMIIYSYTKSFDFGLGSAAAIMPDSIKNIVFIMFLIGFGTKAGIIPLHIWLPSAHPAAPSNISALMSGIMIKTAIYGLIRFIPGCLGVEHSWWGITILALGIVSAVLGVAYALMEHNIKRLLAFSSVENIGIILIGLGVCFIALAQNNQLISSLALTAALLHTFNHALFKGGLFLGAGSIQYAAHTRDIEKLGGLIKKMPLTGFFVLCFSLAISAIVPFNGFISEWLAYQSLYAFMINGETGLNILFILAVAALGLAGALAAACFVKLFGFSFLGLSRSEQALRAEEVPLSMNIAMGILTFLCLLSGLFPLVALKLIDPVTVSLGGSSIFSTLRGGFLIVYYPLEAAGNTISPLIFVIFLVIFIALILLAARVVGGKYLERRYGTWDCGFEALNSRMQYSATGYAKPIKIVFRILFKPTRQVVMEGDSIYHPDAIQYKTSYTSIFVKYLYHPILLAVKDFAKITKYKIQTGSIHSYLLYIFIAVMAMMLYNRFL